MSVSKVYSLWVLAIANLLITSSVAFWDDGTTTELPEITDDDRDLQTSFYMWPKMVTSWPHLTPGDDSMTPEGNFKRFLNCVAGISVGKVHLSTGIILNRRTVITAANFLEPYVSRMEDVRVWALGRGGWFNTPFRYRVWRFRRLIPKSLNPEHYHGPRGGQLPRHDIAIIHTIDIMYLSATYPTSYLYAYKGFLCEKNTTFVGGEELMVVGTGFTTWTHIRENYRFKFSLLNTSDIVNCERYLPKWWGKFVCIINRPGLLGVQNGGGLFIDRKLIGLGCFEIRYNDDRILVFTDLRYYIDLIQVYSNLTVGEYYDYAYQAWGSDPKSWSETFSISGGTLPFIPAVVDETFLPLGK